MERCRGTSGTINRLFGLLARTSLRSEDVGEYTGGQSTPGTVWQLTVSPDFQVGTSPVVIEKPVPAGTMFLGILTEFENIVDTRLQ